MTETYTFTVAPDYTNATYARGNHFATLDEWCGRTLADFAAGMAGRGFRYRAETYTLSRGEFTEHVWEKAV